MKYNLCCDCPLKVSLSLSNSGCKFPPLGFFNSFNLTSFGEVSLSLLLGKWLGHSFLKYESQISKLLGVSASWLLTINTVVRINPEDFTLGGHRMDTQPGEQYKLHLFDSLKGCLQSHCPANTYRNLSPPFTDHIYRFNTVLKNIN